MSLTRSEFGNDFNWGVSTAAYQIEGGHNADGKGLSIWDVFSRKKRKIYGGHHGETACDFYSRYPSDIALMKEMHIPNFRFSISWSRIFPNGIGSHNPAGLDFYDRLIDECLENDICPWVTLYHWDLPLFLENKGGWNNRDIVQWFEYYVEFCGRRFGDRVRRWMILNEPMVFTGAGYFLGVHAPGKKGLNSFLSAAHHAALCQAAGGRILKAVDPGFFVGTTFSYSHIEPFRPLERDRLAARKADALLNRFFLEPLLGLGYPTGDLKILREIEKYFKPGDEERLVFHPDFVGLQNYTRELVRYALLMPFLKVKIIKAGKRKVEKTQMDWEVYPPAIYEALLRLGRYEKIPQIIVTENGAAFEDLMINGSIEDPKRMNYLRDHLREVLRAKKDGAPVKGYFVWTFMDNFEWAEGYYPKFGLVHVDFKTQERLVKASGKWYARFLDDGS